MTMSQYLAPATKRSVEETARRIKSEEADDDPVGDDDKHGSVG
jgi:hypothetical protein